MKVTHVELLSHQRRCFGRGSKELRRSGPCPKSCKRLCKHHRFDDTRAPRVINGRAGGPFTPIVNVLLRPRWGLDPEPSHAAKRVYLHLVSKTQPTNRVVAAPVRSLAREAGMSVGSYRAHLRSLAKVDLIACVLLAVFHEFSDTKRNAIIVLDLPDEIQGRSSAGGGAPRERSEYPELDDDL